ncbi:glycosyltransferase family 4 protein [Roseomonas aerophila]|uniref:Glycosyltransferase family 4 protein n=1 Tax=Teichococcus aerophilus TaxID=1224513 RepID=A0ABR7RPJ8_9PROT|nr:glycosyltransferase family 4 protein [Pseudoroseomonas aerophila]
MSAPLLLHVFPSFSVGGAQVRLAKLVNRFGQRWRHAVVALDGRTECLERIDAGVDFNVLPSPLRPGQSLPSRLLSIQAFLRQLRPDLLVTSNWGSIEWAMARLMTPSLPHLHTEDGFGPEESQGQFRRRILTRRAALRWSEVVVPSKILLRSATGQWRLPATQVHYIPNGLDLSQFQPRPDNAVGESLDPVIGTVAALRAEKNLPRLLRAASMLRQQGLRFRLAILGHGPEREPLDALVTALGLGDRVTFAGHVADPSAAYQGFDIFALSSDTEQMPFSILEAMASGLPIASTNAGDVAVMVSAANAPHVVRHDDTALAESLRPLLMDAALRRRLGGANRIKAEQDYDQEAMFQHHARLIERGCAAPEGRVSAVWRQGSV